MKRHSIDESDGEERPIAEESATKKIRAEEGGEEVSATAAKTEEEEEEEEEEVVVEDKSPVTAELGEDLLLEVLKRADERSLGRVACVSRQWRRLAEDERLWEAVCTRHWANIGCANHQLRSVVLALGGFRRLHSLYLLPLLKTFPISLLRKTTAHIPRRWGKDEVQLSLSLLSIGYFEKMNPLCKRGSG